MEIKKNDSLDYALFGILRSFAGHLFEHPCDVHRARAQSLPHFTSYQVFQEIYKNKGFKGWMDGFIPNFKKRAIKEAARWPLVNTLFPIWKKRLDGELAPKLATGASVAAAETILLPLDRLMVAKVNEKGYRYFYENQIKHENLRTSLSSLYRGANAVLCNRLFGWMAFLFSDSLVKHQLKKWDPDSKHPILGKMLFIGVTAGNLSLFALPFDFMKTRIQMDKSNHLKNLRLNNLIKTLYRAHGIKGFYSGAIFDMTHRSIHVFLTAALFEKITTSHSK